jgi:hypothetical protein
MESLLNKQIELLANLQDIISDKDKVTIERGNYYLTIEKHRNKDIKVDLNWNENILNSLVISYNIYNKASSINFYYEKEGEEDFLEIAIMLLKNHEI